MSSHSSFKAAFLQGESFVSEPKNDTVRTDFLLQNIFSYMLGDKHIFDPVSNLNAKERDILEIYKRTLDNFADIHDQPLKNLCAELDGINEEFVCHILSRVADELFSEMITWGRIIAFFAFVKELAFMCIQKELPASIVDVIFENFSMAMKAKVESWIEFHGGWDGITLFRLETKPFRIRKTSWVIFLLHAIIKTFGIFSAVDNIVNRNIYYFY